MGVAGVEVEGGSAWWEGGDTSMFNQASNVHAATDTCMCQTIVSKRGVGSIYLFVHNRDIVSSNSKTYTVPAKILSVISQLLGPRNCPKKPPNHSQKAQN